MWKELIEMKYSLELKTRKELKRESLIKFEEEFYNNYEKPDDDKTDVQTTLYYAVRKSDDKIVGCIELRHTLTAELQIIGGNIGYRVLQGERQKGYATQMLKLVLEKAKQYGLKEVMLTSSIENRASISTILRCGGVLEREEPFTYANEKYYKFWICI